MKTINNFICERLTLNKQSSIYNSLISDKDYIDAINNILKEIGGDHEVTVKNPTFQISGWPSTSKIDFFKEIAKDIPCYLLKTDWMKNNIYEFNVNDILKYYCHNNYDKAIEEISNMIDRYMAADPYEN